MGAPILLCQNTGRTNQTINRIVWVVFEKDHPRPPKWKESCLLLEGVSFNSSTIAQGPTFSSHGSRKRFPVEF